MAKDNVFGNIAQGITAPIGGAIRGVARGLFPGAAKAADVKYDTLKRQKDMQQLQLMLSMMKDPSSNQQTKKAASDTARRILFSYHPEFENLGAGPMMGRGWGDAMGGIPKGMMTSKIEIGKEGYPSYTFEPEQQFGDVPGAYSLVPEEKRAGIAEKQLVKPATQINIMPSSAERTQIAVTRASIDALDNLKILFDSAQTKTGPITGRISPIAGLVGMTTDEQEAFMAATSAFKNAIIKEITGAQMSEQEASRIMKQIPDITDPPARWKAKWEQSRKNLEFLQKRRLEILQQSGIRVPGETELPTKKTIGGLTPEQQKRREELRRKARQRATPFLPRGGRLEGIREAQPENPFR